MTVSEQTTADVGCYSYGLTHLMKPHRMRITHELVTAYGMLPKMNILVRLFHVLCSVLLCSDFSPIASLVHWVARDG